MGVKVREKPKGSGVYWIFINHDGRRKSKKVGTDEKTALKVAEKVKAKLTLKEFKIENGEKKKIPTFKEYATLWMETYVKPLRRRSTYLRYQVVFNKYLFPDLGSTPIDQINRGEIRNLLLKYYGRGLSKGSVRIIKDSLSGPLSFAIDEGLIPVNHTTGIMKRLNMEKSPAKVEPLNHEEVDLFLGACQKDHPEYFPFFLCAFRTGMRLGELLALRWGDVDWHGSFIRVSRSYKLGQFSPTKTNQERRVDMSNQLTETLRRLYASSKVQGLALGKGEAVEMIFNRDGKPLEQNFIRRIFKRVLEKAGLREIRLHDVRHTYASLLLSEGVTPVYVKEQLGHNSISMTVDIYGHLIPNSNREAVNRLDFKHPSAPYPHPAQNENGQDVEISPAFLNLVPKRGLEPLQAFAY